MSNRHLNAAWAARIADPQAKLILVRLADRAKLDSGLCWPTMEDMVRDTELHKSTICRKLEMLESLGWISRKRRKIGSEIIVNLERSEVAPCDFSNGSEVAHSDLLNGSRSRTQRPKKSHTATSRPIPEVAHSDREVAHSDFSILENPKEPKEKSPLPPPPIFEEPWDAAPMPRQAALDRLDIEARINALDPLGGWWKRPHFARTQREELDANYRIFADLAESDWCLLWRFCDAVIPADWGNFWRPTNRGRLVQDIHDVLGHADRWVSECKKRKIEPAIPKEFPWPADYKSPADLLAEQVAAQRAIANETPAQAAQRLRDREKAERRATAKLNGKP